MMWKLFSFLLLAMTMTFSVGEGRGAPNNIVLVNSVCVMVDDVTYKNLTSDRTAVRKYDFRQLIAYDGCKPLPNLPPGSDAKGKFISQLSNRCSIGQQMKFAMEAGAVGLMIVVSNNISRYPFEVDLGDVANNSIPLVVLTEGLYRQFVNYSGGDVAKIQMTLKALPALPKFLVSFVMFHVFAFICLACGSWLSVNGLNGLKYAPVFGAPQTRTVREGRNRTRPNANQNQCQTNAAGYLSVFMLLIFAAGMLLLLYFFYDIFVWVLIVTIMIVFAVALKSTLMEIICRLPTLKDMDGHFVIESKYLRALIGPELDKRSMVIFPFCLIPSILWIVYRKNYDAVWVIQDIMGLFACSNIIKTVRFGNLKYLTFLCVCFFVYDIFMVYITPLFRTITPPPAISHFEHPLFNNVTHILKRVKRSSSGGSVMEDVATGAAGKSGEKLPILFILPYWNASFREVVLPCFQRSYSMLGFGDIIVPGIVAAYAFLCDSKFKEAAKGCCRLLYLPVVIVGYHVGLLLVFLILIVMKTGQPALLTLIPCTIIPFVVTAAIRRQLQSVWTGNFLEAGLDQTEGGNEEEILQGRTDELS